MPVKIRPVDLQSEHSLLLDLLERNLGIARDVERFEWLYRRNPCGKAWAWFAYENDKTNVIGSASVFPRAMWLAGQIHYCGQVGHFSVDPGYRSLGPALLLQRATFAPVMNGELAACYDTPPHSQGMATFHRLGMTESCVLSRYARVLRVNCQLERRLGKIWLVPALAHLGNACLNVLDRCRMPVPSGLEVALHDGQFADEFSHLDKEVASNGRIRLRRNADDLNWKYCADPRYTYKVLTARRYGELIAFAIYAVEGNDARIVDIFGRADTPTWLTLIDAVAASVKKETHAETLHGLFSEKNTISPMLRRACFSRREGVVRVVAFVQPGSELESQLSDGGKWSLNYADYAA